MALELETENYQYDESMVDATRRDGVSRMRIYRPRQTMIVLGRGSKPEKEINIEAAIADGIPILRRRGGGCAVVLDRGNIIVSTTLAIPGIMNSRRYHRSLTAWLISGIHAAGYLGISENGISDLVFGARKIGGSSIYRSKNLLYYSTTLLITPDVSLMEKYLAHPPREPDYRHGRSHAEFVIGLADLMPIGSVEEVALNLAVHLAPPSAQIAKAA